MINKASIVASLASSFLLAGSVALADDLPNEDSLENSSRQQLSRTSLSVEEIASRISSSLASLQEELEGEEVVAVLEEIAEVLNDDSLLLHEPVSRALFEGSAPLLQHKIPAVRLYSVIATGMVGAANIDCASEVVALIEPLKNDSIPVIRDWAYAVSETIENSTLALDDKECRFSSNPAP
jgi:hypothetical protein